VQISLGGVGKCLGRGLHTPWLEGYAQALVTQSLEQMLFTSKIVGLTPAADS
jgi:hypothetical protein